MKLKTTLLTAVAALMLAAGNAHAGLDDTYAEDCAKYGGEGTVDKASGTISWHVSKHTMVEAFVDDKCAMCTIVADPGMSYSKADVKDFVARNGGTSGVWQAYDAGPRYLRAWVNQDDTMYAGLAVDGSAIRVCYKWWLESRGRHHAEPSNAEASAAMDRLQAAKGKPHVTSGVWYDSATDTYNWIGPKFGRPMSEPASQFLDEVGPYLEPLQTPDFNNWTTETLHLIFIPTAHITYAHGKIKTVTFPFRPKDEDGYPTQIRALELFHLLFMFLFGPKEESNPHMHNLEDGAIPGVISEKDPETGYIVARDDKGEKNFDVQWRYHFVITKNDTTILTAELIPSDEIGPRFIVHIAEPLH